MSYRIVGLLLVLLSFTLPLGAQDNPIPYDQPRFVLDSNAKNSPIVDLAYSPDGMFLAAAGSNTVVLWIAATGEAAMQLEAEESINRIVFLPDGDLLVVYGDNHILIWNIPVGDRRADFTIEHPIVDVSISPDGETLGLVYGTGVSLLNLPAAQAGEVLLHDIVANDGQRNWNAVAFDPSGQYLAAGYVVYGGPITEFAVSMWDVKTDELVREFDLQTSYAVTDLKFNAAGTLLAATGTYTKVWYVQTGDMLYMTTSNGDSGVSFGGDYLTIADPAPHYNALGTTALYDAPTGDLLGLFKQSVPETGGGGGDGLFYQPVVFHPAGTQFATPDKGGQVVVWDVPADLATADTPVNIFAYCDDLSGRPKRPTTADEVNIIWSWYATEIPLLFDHMGWASYVITLDGRDLPLDTVRRSAIRRDSVNDNHWTLYYGLNVGTLNPGSHTITYALTWGSAISDGLDEFGPGTSNLDDIGACTFEVDG